MSEELDNLKKEVKHARILMEYDAKSLDVMNQLLKMTETLVIYMEKLEKEEVR